MLQKKLFLAHLALLTRLACPFHLFGQKTAAIAMPLTSIDNQALNRLPLAALSGSQTRELSAAAEPNSGFIRPAPPPAKKQFTVRPFSTVALSLKLGTLGPGIDLATPLSRSLNLRVGANFLNLGYGFHLDKMQYQPRVYLRSGQVHLD